jgi:hypothetical protein
MRPGFRTVQGLADPARADEGDQAVTGEQPDHRGRLLVPADEAGQRHRQAYGSGGVPQLDTEIGQRRPVAGLQFAE